MAEIQRKCAEKQLKIRTGNWFLPGLMIVLLLLGAAAVTCLHFGIQDQKRQPDCWMKQNRKEKFCWKTTKSGPGYLFECGR